jgi:hypothetical protein
MTKFQQVRKTLLDRPDYGMIGKREEQDKEIWNSAVDETLRVANSLSNEFSAASKLIDEKTLEHGLELAKCVGAFQVYNELLKLKA